jgi:hypothetical protein
MAVAAATATMSATAAIPRRRIVAGGAGGGEDGKFLGQLLGAAVRALGSLPSAGTDEDFAVAPALFAMEFVNRHGKKITFYGGRTSGNRFNRRKRR